MRTEMKKSPTALILVFLGALGVLAVNASPSFAGDAPALKSKTAFHWPKGMKAAVSLTYDDAIPTQLNNAIPALDQDGLTGTFFIEGNNVNKDNEGKWEAASKEGHEIACHTILHPCLRETLHQKGFALEDFTLKRMSKELDASIALARKLSGKKGPFTFAYPCGETTVGEGESKKSYIPLVAKKFLAARTVEPAIEDPNTTSFPQVHDMEGNTAEKLIAAVKKAEEQGGWVVFLFHGVGGDYLSTDLKAHKGLLDYLATHRDAVWTGTFGDVAKYVKNHRTTK